MDETLATVQYKKVPVQQDKQAFLRKVWIHLANRDAAPALFDMDFEPVELLEHQVYYELARFDVEYTARIGNDREEPYITSETYYEEVPYTVKERYYSTTLGTYVEETLTKLKKVERQRPVTKYKTVTDWTPTSGEHTVCGAGYAHCTGAKEFDMGRFSTALAEVEKDLLEPTEEECARMTVTEVAREKVMDEQTDDIDYAIHSLLGGDQDEIMNLTVEDVELLTQELYLVPEYRTKIDRYVLRAFPFGKMVLSGDVVGQKKDLSALHSEKQAAFDSQKRKKQADSAAKIKAMQTQLDAYVDNAKNTALPNRIWNGCKNAYYRSIGLLLLTVFLAIFVPSMILIGAAFVAAVFAFIRSRKQDALVTMRETKAVKEEIEAEKKRVADEIKAENERISAEVEEDTQQFREEMAQFTANYNRERRGRLDKKLAALGLAPAEDEELTFR